MGVCPSAVGSSCLLLVLEGRSRSGPSRTIAVDGGRFSRYLRLRCPDLLHYAFEGPPYPGGPLVSPPCLPLSTPFSLVLSNVLVSPGVGVISDEESPTRARPTCRANEFDWFSRKRPRELRAMPRPLKQLNPYASWTRLFGAARRQLRLKAPDGDSLAQADLGRLIAYSGATVSAVERGTLRPEEAFVEACERELNAG